MQAASAVAPTRDEWQTTPSRRVSVQSPANPHSFARSPAHLLSTSERGLGSPLPVATQQVAFDSMRVSRERQDVAVALAQLSEGRQMAREDVKGNTVCSAIMFGS